MRSTLQAARSFTSRRVCRALVTALYIGKRVGYPQKAMPPHSVVLSFIGACLLWVGWFGFNAGSALGSGTAWQLRAPSWRHTSERRLRLSAGWLPSGYRNGKPSRAGWYLGRGRRAGWDYACCWLCDSNGRICGSG